ncbi:hypothetical protein TREMEDRAFT_67459 [Tremella mesenterica DSM 1558]|uniref:uncharacterized protein n=1 Tax=Tremella mesenterica (strain ATCC 24925 / CBS 8224 / DSM 1558 / NBRC 9311 / NRRL Y-6157 / RJB 2259-6 / UBC 559-6) TaxID=578456 RepID=UPI0003F48C57|nr:uncharacterized protein TREMEDRAFT_67459 [Tremella mesenterica DSM 1558]EIW73622.1 hypothetical protein TREMEDRAFT_67459 [Tremella mesenterica DSM 1558]
MAHQATISAPVNIACINHDLRSTTTAQCDPIFSPGDKLWLNGKEEVVKFGGRTATCIEVLRGWRRDLEKDKGLEPLSTYPLRVASHNNFPTAAGLASSASGLAALVFSLATLYSLPQSLGQLSLVARQGSGSACRSLFGGYVAWREGTQPDGSDSIAEEIAPRDHWPEMCALICVVSDAKKGTSSTSGMQRTVETSTLLQHRLTIVPERMTAISHAIKERNFDSFAQITMTDSNSFHAVCLDTSPPIFYMNDVSRSIIAMVEELNRVSGELGYGRIAAYTFDAGPNAVIYALEKWMGLVEKSVRRWFPQENIVEVELEQEGKKVLEKFDERVMASWGKGAVKSLIKTRVGDGPRVLGEKESLLKDGQLKNS